MIDADEALLRLREGNEQFRSRDRAHIEVDAAGRGALVDSQSPFAVILGCSDSRVPPELIFNQGFGDLFVIRVAGNVVAPSQIGSVEFAAENFGTRLVVVLGHSGCGAVRATLDQLRQSTESRSPHLRAIVDLIRPGVEPLLATAETPDDRPLLERAVQANIEAMVHKLRHGSRIPEELIAANDLKIVGAEYCLESGIVRFL